MTDEDAVDWIMDEPTNVSAWQWLVKQPHGLHVACTILAPGTDAHLVMDHGESFDRVHALTKADRIRRHMELHREEDANDG